MVLFDYHYQHFLNINQTLSIYLSIYLCVCVSPTLSFFSPLFQYFLPFPFPSSSTFLSLPLYISSLYCPVYLIYLVPHPHRSELLQIIKLQRPSARGITRNLLIKLHCSCCLSLHLWRFPSAFPYPDVPFALRCAVRNQGAFPEHAGGFAYRRISP